MRAVALVHRPAKITLVDENEEESKSSPDDRVRPNRVSVNFFRVNSHYLSLLILVSFSFLVLSFFDRFSVFSFSFPLIPERKINVSFFFLPFLSHSSSTSVSPASFLSFVLSFRRD